MIGSSLSPLSTSTFHYFLWPFSTDVQKKKPFMLWESNHLPYVCLYIFERNPYLHFQLACFNSGLLLLYTSCWVLVGSAHPRNILEPRKSGWQYLIGQYFPSKPPNELPSKLNTYITQRFVCCNFRGIKGSCFVCCFTRKATISQEGSAHCSPC